MSTPSQLNTDAAQALDIVREFHEYFSSPPPFVDGGRFTVSRGLVTVPLPPEMGGLRTENFEDMYERVSGLLAKQQESGPTGFKHQLAEPQPDVWVSQSIAAVFGGWSASIDGRGEFVHTVHLCTLHRQSDGILANENPWRISGLVDGKHLSPELPAPPVETGLVSEIIAPFESLLKCIRDKDWEAIPSLLLPGAGATTSRNGNAPETLMWSEFIQRLQSQAENENEAEKRLLDCEARRCGDLGFVWAPFVLGTDGSETVHGVSACSFRLESGRWVISSLCETYYTK
ncbi:hypothetical protein FLAG1_08519 [Fusarium langsethiae]|uniref:Uncharacterized protein n=1 Tax=Fusarium langsethiae TaxID=179993 RepID=A0A0M9ESL8_FUSLA|nr:hypothetical protein FLAG1_08519 [Fusarium langsethiae]GKU21222.1 unnamed protein product [Fusarium langsethiae]